MRIGIVCYPTYGGSGAVATELGLALAERGHEIHFISYAQPFRLRGYNERVTFHEVRIGAYPLFEHPPYSIALAVTLEEVAVRHGLDVIHAHYAIPHAACAWLAREMLRPERPLRIMTTLHGTDITLVGQESSFYSITKFSIEQSDEVTAVSTFLKDETYRAFGCVSCDLKVIPNFVNLAEYHPLPRAERHSPAPAGHKVISHVSNFREVKRVRDVIRVFARIRKAMPATLLMVGDGPDRPPAETLARELGLEDHVTFLGKQPHVERLIPLAHVLLLPSELESFGLAALEGMACGVPAVSTLQGGLPELIADGLDGCLEPVGDIAAQARRVIELLTDDHLYARFSGAARQTAQARFCSTILIPQYERYYEEVCRL
jgi:N-acetyl-alpha-D-glucosaminyl L-malate synthase BshA